MLYRWLDFLEIGILRLIEYRGRCHCGLLGVRYLTALDRTAWSVRACQCSFCRSHGALTTSDPEGLLEFRSTDAAEIQRYRFGGRSADFMICRECGVYVGAQVQTDLGRFGILNVLSLYPPMAGLPTAEPQDYGAESVEVRRLRREAHWTPLVPESR